MAKIEDSITLLVPAKTVWYRLIEFERWNEWLWAHIPADGKVALGDSMRCLGGEGTEMRFGLFGDGVQKQAMRIMEWAPPKSLVLSLDGWNWKSVMQPGYKGSEKPVEIMGTLGALSLSFSAEVVPVSDLETKFTFRIESAFTHPIGGPLLTLVYAIPWRFAMRKLATEFTGRFTQSFEKPRAA